MPVIQCTASFADRLWSAKMDYLKPERGRQMTDQMLVDRVARVLGRDPVDAGTGGRWFKGTQPSLATIAALAIVFEVDPGWLAFGELSMAPAPGLTTQAKVVEMIAKTQKVVQDEKPKAAAPKRKKAQNG